MTYTQAVEFLESYGVKVALLGTSFTLIRDCAEIIQRLEKRQPLDLHTVKEFLDGLSPDARAKLLYLYNK